MKKIIFAIVGIALIAGGIFAALEAKKTKQYFDEENDDTEEDEAIPPAVYRTATEHKNV